MWGPRVRTLVTILLLAACAAVGTEPLPGEPLHHVQGGFRNTNPEFRRPEGWTRTRFLLSRAWANTFDSRSFEAPRVANDGMALRRGAGPDAARRQRDGSSDASPLRREVLHQPVDHSGRPPEVREGDDR